MSGCACVHGKYLPYGKGTAPQFLTSGVTMYKSCLFDTNITVNAKTWDTVCTY